MKLVDLDAAFLKFLQKPDTWVEIHDGQRVEVSGVRHFHQKVDSLADADGVSFLCPLCFKNNHGRVGTHLVICWFKGKIPDSVVPGPGRWNPSGTGLGDLTFVGPGAYSVRLTSGCMWHGFVKDGSAE